MKQTRIFALRPRHGRRHGGLQQPAVGPPTATAALALITLCAAMSGRAADWPMFRYDAGRTAASPHRLPDQLRLQWIRELPPPQRAWQDASNAMLWNDHGYDPIVVGKHLIIGSMNEDTVTAYHTATGVEAWRFYAEGPIRFAPAGFNGKLYVASDDGYLYCLSAATGKLLWKFRGGPSGRKVIGNGRLIGAWPARTGPAVHAGRVYFAAGIWPFGGIFIYALNADTGQLVWENSGSGPEWVIQPHGAPSFAGIAPQGYVTVTGNTLIIPNGRQGPAGYRLDNGQTRYYVGAGSGPYVAGSGPYYLCENGRLADAATGRNLSRSAPGVIESNLIYSASDHGVTAAALPRDSERKPNLHGVALNAYKLKPVFDAKTKGNPQQVLIKAGPSLFCEGTPDGVVLRIDRDGTQARLTAQHNVPARIWRLLAGDARLFVVTRDHRVYCFGNSDAPVRTHPVTQRPRVPADAVPRLPVDKLLKHATGDTGYVVVLGLGAGQLVEALVAGSRLHVVVIDPDADKINALRRNMTDRGMYGTRVCAFVGDPFDYPLPPYMATLIVAEDPLAAGFARRRRNGTGLFNALRPYGGVACLPEVDGLGEWAASAKQVTMRRADGMVIVTRPGPLPGAGQWTHQYANAANTGISNDTRVQAPLGLLWFGGAPNDAVLPRHGHGPAPQVAGGRLFIEGEHMLRALDVFTGRLLWEKPEPNIGFYYRHTVHHPGAGEIGSNFVSLDDTVYLMAPENCLALDPANGATRAAFTLPPTDGAPTHWGSIRVWQDLLIATGAPYKIAPPLGYRRSPDDKEEDQAIVRNARYASAGAQLIVMQRETGAVRWTRHAQQSFRHNAIAVAAGKIFCIDGLSQGQREALGSQGLPTPTRRSVLYALDAATGRIIWQTEPKVPGTFLNYAEPHDILLLAGSDGRDRAWDEIHTGAIAYRGTDGAVIWQKPSFMYDGPLLIWKDQFISNGMRGRGYRLLTGERAGWSWSREYGCNTIVGSQNLLVFRSGAAGYFDLLGMSGTGNIGGIKSGCTSNMIIADGVLCVPDYTRTCTCAYHNQTSLALIHLPAAEMWTFGGRPTPGRVGINLGAPGDRLSDAGTLWVEAPTVSTDAPRVAEVKIEGGVPFRRDSSRIVAPHMAWVAASGLSGVKRLHIKLLAAQPADGYTVRLYFAEPLPQAKPGDRVFDVTIQGRPVLEALDIAAEAGGAQRLLVREFPGLMRASTLTIAFRPKKGEPLICGVEMVQAQ